MQVVVACVCEGTHMSEGTPDIVKGDWSGQAGGGIVEQLLMSTEDRV